MSDNTINAALRYVGFAKEVMTAHGFRATARTILDEVQGDCVNLIEHQQAHRVIDPNGRAYNRTAYLPAVAAPPIYSAQSWFYAKNKFSFCMYEGISRENFFMSEGAKSNALTGCQVLSLRFSTK